jgi:CRISPR/Cas system CMR subunit Cmr6 (Cas7 group RAMP superfamily)
MGVLTSRYHRSWREKQAQEIEAREEAAKAKKEDQIAKARNDIDNFYKQYNERKEKDIAKNKCVFRFPHFFLRLPPLAPPSPALSLPVFRQRPSRPSAKGA